MNPVFPLGMTQTTTSSLTSHSQLPAPAGPVLRQRQAPGEQPVLLAGYKVRKEGPPCEVAKLLCARCEALGATQPDLARLNAYNAIVMQVGEVRDDEKGRVIGMLLAQLIVLPEAARTDALRDAFTLASGTGPEDQAYLYPQIARAVALLPPADRAAAMRSMLLKAGALELDGRATLLAALATALSSLPDAPSQQPLLTLLCSALERLPAALRLPALEALAGADLKSDELRLAAFTAASDSMRADPGVATAPALELVVRSHPASPPLEQTFSFTQTIKAEDIRIQAQGAVEKGATARVYRGLWGQETVALKRLGAYYRDEEGRLHEYEYDDGGETLQWEVSRLASVCHPNVVQFHGLCHQDGKTYLVMEWCDQGDLQDALEKGGLGNARLWQWMIEISAGLAHLHGQGILHRDLKTANILIDAHGRAKLADLGFAQVDALLEKTELNAVNLGIQSPFLIAPENSRAGEARYNNKATDLYALGLLFWTMVNQGAVPASWQEIALRKKEQLPVPDSCPPAFKALILSCCHPNPHQRATLEEVLQQLQHMGPQLHPDHALIGLLEHLEQALHDRREAARHYVPSQVTQRRIEGSIESYWEQWEAHSLANAAASALGSAAPCPPTNTGQPAPNIYSTAPMTTAAASRMQNPPAALQTDAGLVLGAALAATGMGALWTPFASAQAIWHPEKPGVVDSVEPPMQQHDRHPAAPAITSGIRPSLTSASSAATAGMVNPPLALDTVIEDFLADPAAGTLLLLGEAGLGKTLSTYVLAEQILQQWWRYFADPARHPKPTYLPIFLRTHVADWSEGKLKAAYVRIAHEYGLQPHQVTPLVIVDGYDECRMEPDQPGNLAAHLGLPEGARLIVSCRPDTVPEAQWRARFGVAGQLQVCHYLPFTSTQILAYLKQHLGWDEATHAAYQVKLQGSPELRTVLRNPFVLYLLWQSWGTVSRKPPEQWTRSDIYAGFIEHMVNSGRGSLTAGVQQRLQASHADLGASFQAFARQLAFLACQERGMTLAAAAAQGTHSPWAQLPDLVRQEARQRFAAREERHAGLTGEAEKKEAKRRMVLTEGDFVQMRQQAAEKLTASLPLRQRGERYEFMHKSVFEYCTAQQLLRLLNEDAQSMTEEALEILLDSIKETCPEVLMFVQESMLAVERKKPATPMEQAGNPQGSRGQRNEAWLLNGIGWVLRVRNQYAKALEHHRRALAIRVKVLDAQHVEIGTSYNNIGLVLHAQGKHAEALDYYHKALAIREKVLGPEHVDTATCYNNIGGVLHDQGKHVQALDCLRKALAIREKVLGQEHVDTTTSYNNIGSVLFGQGKHEQALHYYRKALNIMEKVLSPEHAYIATSYNNFGSVLADQGKHAEALDYHRKALDIREKILGTEHADTGTSYAQIGTVLHAQGKHAEALDYLRKALTIQEKALGPEHVETTTFYNNMGTVLHAQGKHAEALDYFRKALDIATSNNHPDVELYRKSVEFLSAKTASGESKCEVM